MVVIARAATNLRCLRAWAARTRDRSDPITHLDPEDDGFEEIDQATAPPARTGPSCRGPRFRQDPVAGS